MGGKLPNLDCGGLRTASIWSAAIYRRFLRDRRSLRKAGMNSALQIERPWHSRTLLAVCRRKIKIEVWQTNTKCRRRALKDAQGRSDNPFASPRYGGETAAESSTPRRRRWIGRGSPLGICVRPCRADRGCFTCKLPGIASRFATTMFTFTRTRGSSSGLTWEGREMGLGELACGELASLDLDVAHARLADVRHLAAGERALCR